MTRTEIVQRLRQIGALRAGDSPPDWLGPNHWGVALSELANAAAKIVEGSGTDTFKLGDIVYLKSGSPPLTVVDVDVCLDLIEVAWFDYNGEYMRDDLPAEAISATEAGSYRSFAEMQSFQVCGLCGRTPALCDCAEIEPAPRGSRN